MSSPDDFREEAARALPPPHEQEPASLRADIVDELADHLACAYRRELLRTQGDAGQSLKNVHARFGNPRAIARKLWFDAMKGRLMAQKLMVAATLASALFIGLLAFAGWRYLEANQQMTSSLIEKTQEANAALLAQNQQANAKMLKQIESIRTLASNPDPNWNPVTVRVVSGTKDGPPAEGIEVRLIPDEKTPGSPAVLTSGPDGLVDFGLRQPGIYSLSVITPSDYIRTHALQVNAGRASEALIICPLASLPVAKMSWSAKWPESLAAHPDRDNMWCLATIIGQPNRDATGNTHWWPRNDDSRLLAFHPDGTVIDLLATEPPEWFKQPELLLAEKRIGGLAPLQAANESAILSDLISRLPAIRDRIMSIRRHRVPTDKILRNGNYRVESWTLARWDGDGSPFAILLNMKACVLMRVGASAPGHLTELCGEKRTSFRVPEKAFDSPEHLAHTQWILEIPEEFARNISDFWDSPSLFENAGIDIDQLQRDYPAPPVEAPRPNQGPPRDPFHPPSKDGFGAVPSYSDPNSSDFPAQANSAPLIVKCLTETGSKPLPGVTVEIGIPSSNGPFNSLQQLITNAAGQADFGEVPSNAYLSRITLPWGEMKTLASSLPEWDATSQKRVMPIPCPDNPPAREKHAYQIRWPTQGKLDDHSPWLVMEVRANYERRVDSTKWISSENYILAIHPDGLARAWKIQADQSGQSVTAMLHNMRRRGRIDTSWESLRPFLSSTEITPYSSPDFIKGSQFRVMGYGLANWDGSGDPISLLQGIQDGRYQHRYRGLFHDLLRTQDSMKSYRGSQLIPQETPARGEKMPTLSFEIPKDLYQSALRRAASVAEVGGAKK